MKSTKQQDLEIPLLERNNKGSRSIPIQAFETDPKPSLPKYLDFNIFNRIFFFWVTTIVNVSFFLFISLIISLQLGNKKTFQQDQHYDLRETEDSGWIAKNFANEWDQVKQESYPLIRTHYRVFKFTIWIAQLLGTALTCFDFTGPVLVSRIITFVGLKGSSLSEGIFLVLMFVVSRIGVIVLSTQINLLVVSIFCKRIKNNDFQSVLQNKVITGTRALIYRKFLKFPLMRNEKYSAGSIMNHMLVDVENMAKIYFHLPQLMQFPVIMLAGIYMIYTSVGIAFIGGVFSVIIITMLVSVITKVLFR